MAKHTIQRLRDNGLTMDVVKSVTVDEKDVARVRESFRQAMRRHPEGSSDVIRVTDAK